MGRVRNLPISFVARGYFRYDDLSSMTTQLLHVGRALTPISELQDVGILMRDGVIEAIGPRSSVRLPAGAQEIIAADNVAVPGFLDVHIHGAAGHDVMEGKEEALNAISAMIARHGTTSFVATTVTAAPDAICKSSEQIAAYIARQHGRMRAGAEILGIHFEGPFISTVRRGVHPPEWIRLPSAEMLEKFVAAAQGNALILTIAPELLGAMP